MKGAGSETARLVMPDRALLKSSAISCPVMSCCVRKKARMRGFQCFALDAVAADALVLGEHYPAAPAGFGQPFDIGRGLGKMIVVHFDRGAGPAQGLRHLLAAETAVDEEDEVAGGLRRHAASGNPLRTISSISARERP